MRRRMRAACGSVVMLIGLCALPAAGQGRLASGGLRASVPADSGDARVSITYVVVAGAGREPVPVTLLRFDGTPVRNVVTRVNGTAVDPTLRADGSGLRLSGAIPLGAGDVPSPEAASQGDATFTIEVEYSVGIVRDEPGRPLRLPVLAVMWPPVPPLPATFAGDVDVPAGTRLYDAFPSQLRAVSGGDASGSVSRRYHVDLPVVPAMISFVLAPADQPVVTLANVLDVSVLLAVAVMWTLMWRQFRREA